MVTKRLVVLLPLVLFAALLAPSGAGAVGELSLQECFGAATGCINEAGEPLALSGGVAVSPSGGAVYATGKEDVTHFFVGGEGKLGYDGCISDDGSGGSCANANSAAEPLRTAQGVLVSPTRQAVYVADASLAFGASSPGDLAHLETLAPGGQLVYHGCVSTANGTSGSCGVTNAADPLEGARSVAVSPDGNSLYAAASGGVPEAGFVSHFIVSSTGGLTFEGCLASFNTASCTHFGSEGAPLGQASAVAVSPTTGNVYVAAPETDAVAHFSTDAAGRLFPGNCVAGAGAKGKCEDAPGSLPDEDRGIAVSPDGASVYVTSDTSAGGLTRLSVQPNGDLRWAECVSADGSGGCQDIPGSADPLARAEPVAVSPDGQSVYVGGERAVSAFRVGSDGKLAYQACYSGEFVEGCTDLTGKPIEKATGIAVSPDGASVYVSSQMPGMLAHFSRARPPVPPSPPPAGGAPGPASTTPLVQGVTAAIHVFTAAELRASLLAQLVPSGKVAAKLAKVKRSKSYALSFKALVAGSLTIDWYFLPKGAHVSAAGKHKAKPKPVLFAAGQAAFAAPSTKTLTIKLTAKALSMLKHRSSIPLTAKGVFTPRGGRAVNAARSFQLKG